jgi:hypothetical protein
MELYKITDQSVIYAEQGFNKGLSQDFARIAGAGLSFAESAGKGVMSGMTNFRTKACIAAACLCAALLAGCAVGPTPYGPKTADTSNGYTDEQLAQNRYRVTYTGTLSTPRDVVENYLIFRAAQVTQQAGFVAFAFADRDTKAHTTYFTDDNGWFGFPHRRRIPSDHALRRLCRDRDAERRSGKGRPARALCARCSGPYGSESAAAASRACACGAWLTSGRAFQSHTRDIAVARHADKFVAFLTAHMRHIDGRHRIVGDNGDDGAGGSSAQSPPRYQGR